MTDTRNWLSEAARGDMAFLKSGPSKGKAWPQGDSPPPIRPKEKEQLRTSDSTQACLANPQAIGGVRDSYGKEEKRGQRN